jgi:hypothetical protein
LEQFGHTPETNGILAIISQEFPNVAIQAGDEKFVKRIAISD